MSSSEPHPRPAKARERGAVNGGRNPRESGDEVTAAELRETFLKLARECGSTAILITHQLEEAISVGDRIVVFGKSAKLLADIHVGQWPKTKHALLREAIQATLQSNAPDSRLTQ